MSRKKLDAIMWTIGIVAGCLFGVIVATHLTGSV
jgi:hypothetical protein